jgi:hypothetical protein
MNRIELRHLIVLIFCAVAAGAIMGGIITAIAGALT